MFIDLAKAFALVVATIEASIVLCIVSKVEGNVSIDKISQEHQKLRRWFMIIRHRFLGRRLRIRG